jgi:hypothetical protein
MAARVCDWARATALRLEQARTGWLEGTKAAAASTVASMGGERASDDEIPH